MGLEQSQHLKVNAPGTLFGNGEHGDIVNLPELEDLFYAPIFSTSYILEAGETLTEPLTIFSTTEIIINGTWSLNGSDGNDGSAGGAGGSGAGQNFFNEGMTGGGGGGAGMIFMCAPVIRLGATAELNVVGGDGGDGEADNSGGGGGGGGGRVVMIYETLVDAGATIDVSGGTGGAGEGTGDAGSNGIVGHIIQVPIKTAMS